MPVEQNFIDYVKIFCKSGKGGAGSKHFHRDKSNPKGGPDGGDGGQGGSVIIKGNKQLWTLLHLKYRKHIKAEPGQDGGAALKTGKSGKDIILEVPLGTVAKDADSFEVLAEIIEDGQTFTLVKGGRGGLGNDHFKSPTNQQPDYAQPGEESVEKWNILELKLLADVGLVGFPNAGKSTLLSVVSAAKPEIADYPFTTLVPNLGIVSYYDDKSFVMADIPGIIEGAAEGRGLGTRFLRHIERNSALLFVISCDTSKEIKEEYEVLLKELEKYNPHLLRKDRAIAVSKCDFLDEELLEEMKKTLPEDVPVFFISSITGMGIDKLKQGLWKILN